MRYRALLVAALIMGAQNNSNAQQALTKEGLINSLRNSGEETRNPVNSFDVEELRRSLRNGLSVEGSSVTQNQESVVRPDKTVAASIGNLPSVNILIYFDYNSASINPESIPDLMTLGNALISPDLAGKRFLVAGHTDAKGTREYNLGLSQRRSEAVQKFLNAAFPTITGRLVSIGFGMEQLINQSNPMDAANRRVQVINIGS